MRLSRMTTRRWMIAGGVMLLGTTSAAAFELSRFLLFIPPQAKAEVDENDIPPDLRIEAQYGAGYSDWKSWKVTIASDGKALQEVFSFGNDTKRGLSLTKRDLKDLLDKAKEADFFALPERYDHPVTDNPTLILKITANKKTHRVDVYAPRHQKDKKGIKRFMNVWSEVLRKVPSPNPEQKPE